MDYFNKADCSAVEQWPRDDCWTCVFPDKSHVNINLCQFRIHSGYFSALLRSQVEEHDKKQVHLQLVSAKLLSQIKTLLDILDSGQFELEVEMRVFSMFSHWMELGEMDTLLTAIDYLDMHTLRNLSDRYYCSLHEIDTDNLEYLLSLCFQFSFKKLEKKVLSFLLKNTWSLRKCDIEILPFSLLKSLLVSSKANVSSEWDMVRVLDTWCVENCRKDAGHVSDENVTELSKCIRIPYLQENSTRHVNMIERIEFVPLRNSIKTSMCDFDLDNENYRGNHPTHFVPRRGQCLLLAMRVPFGRKLDRACSFSQDFSIDNNEDIIFNESKLLSSSIPCDSLREFCVCSVGQHVYVAGGQRKYSLAGQFAVKDVYRLDLDKLKWDRMCPMKTSRCLYYLDSVDGHLYAAGGINVDGEISSVERYNIMTDQWSDVQSLDYRIHEHAGCVHNKQLYISGGHDGTSPVSTLSRYDVTSNTWSRCAPMLTSRSCHTLTCLNDRLYVIGGSKIRKCKVYGMQSIECYSIQTDQWSDVQSHFPSVYTACLSVYARPQSGRLLVLGGYSYKCHRYTVEMHSFCERTCTWSKVPIHFNSTHKDKTDVKIIEVKTTKQIADQLVRDRRSCTLR